MSLFLNQSPSIQLPHLRRGQIQLILGPMFSGKTTELIRRCRRLQIANYKCVVIKYARDNRYSNDQVATHDEQKLSAVNAVELGGLLSYFADFEVIGIDEGQFFPDVVEISERLANDGKMVIVAALDGTFQREPFGRILELVPKAEHLMKLNAICQECFHDASFTKRKGDEKTIEVIGGSELYSAACRDCHAGKTHQRRNAASQTPIKNGEKPIDVHHQGTDAGLIITKASDVVKCKLDFDNIPAGFCKTT